MYNSNNSSSRNLKSIKLIVGLANPGNKYTLTRHNVGAWYINLLAKKHNQCLKEDSKFFGYTAKIVIADNHIHLLIPTTYINLSGQSVLAMANFYRILPKEILVAHDELNLMPGIVKLKFGGSNNGHNGLKDIQHKLWNDPNFYRLRIGIGHPGDKQLVVSFVLNQPSIQERELILNKIDEAVYCTSILFNEGFHTAISRLHANSRSHLH